MDHSCDQAPKELEVTVALPQDEHVFNPSREIVLILRQADAISKLATQLCQPLFAIEGRAAQSKLCGFVGLVLRYPAHCVHTACARALERGVYSYKRMLALIPEDMPVRSSLREPTSFQAVKRRSGRPPKWVRDSKLG